MSFDVKEILSLPDKEKKHIADLIYESLAFYNGTEVFNEQIPEWQKKILDDRIKEMVENPKNFLTLEQTKKEFDIFYAELRNKKTGS